MKKLFLVLVLTIKFFTSTYSLSQSGWYNTFFNNTSTFSKIVQRDSLNYFAHAGLMARYFQFAGCLINLKYRNTIGFAPVAAIQKFPAGIYMYIRTSDHTLGCTQVKMNYCCKLEKSAMVA